ncbi:MAG: hypothetical protein V8T36_06165 [Ruthenibacterium lactatiformans]
MKDYIKIARPYDWIKNLFIFPGTLFALLLVGWKGLRRPGRYRAGQFLLHLHDRLGQLCHQRMAGRPVLEVPSHQ